jgi:hypothetical protein
MNLSYIAANLHKFRRIDLEHAGNVRASLLCTMFGDFLDCGAKDYIANLLDLSRVSVYGVINVDVISDENCIVQILALDGKPVGLCSKFGDRSEWKSRILDLVAYKNFARELVEASLEYRLNNLKAKPMDALAELENRYVKFLGDKESMFSVENAKSVNSFRKIPNSHRCFFLDSKGNAVLVQEIRQFANTKGSWCDDPDTHDVIVIVNGAEGTVDGRELLFELVEGEADLDDARTAFPDKACWAAETVSEHTLTVSVAEFMPFRRVPRVTRFRLRTIEDIKRFTNAYFDHETETIQFTNGVFSLSSIGFEGTILPHN